MDFSWCTPPIELVRWVVRLADVIEQVSIFLPRMFTKENKKKKGINY